MPELPPPLVVPSRRTCWSRTRCCLGLTQVLPVLEAPGTLQDLHVRFFRNTDIMASCEQQSYRVDLSTRRVTNG